MSDTSPVEIFSIGTELLIGRIQDTNSYWLSQQVTELGGIMGRVTIVGDDRATIIEALGAAVRRGARTVITTGGLGPTPDDLTVECIAELLGVGTAIDRPTIEDSTASARDYRGGSLSGAATHGDGAGWCRRAAQPGGVGAVPAGSPW